jgi:hypothetical protein
MDERRQHQQRDRPGRLTGEFGVRGKGAVAAERPSAHRGQEDVVLSPQHSFGHAGGAAGVEDVQIITAELVPSCRGLCCSDDGFVIDGPRQQVVARVVGDLDEHPQMRQVCPDGSDARCELCVIDNGARVGVGEQEGEFVLDVPVADVEGRHARAIAGDHRLEVFGAVAQIDSQVVLPGFVPRQILSFGMTAEFRRAQVCGEGIDAAIDLAICQAARHTRMS